MQLNELKTNKLELIEYIPRMDKCIIFEYIDRNLPN